MCAFKRKLNRRAEKFEENYNLPKINIHNLTENIVLNVIFMMENIEIIKRAEKNFTGRESFETLIDYFIPKTFLDLGFSLDINKINHPSCTDIDYVFNSIKKTAKKINILLSTIIDFLTDDYEILKIIIIRKELKLIITTLSLNDIFEKFDVIKEFDMKINPLKY